VKVVATTRVDGSRCGYEWVDSMVRKKFYVFRWLRIFKSWMNTICIIEEGGCCRQCLSCPGMV